MARFLTQAWIDALNEAAAGHAMPPLSLTLRHLIGEVIYVVRVEDGGVRASLEDAPADVTFVEDYETAAAIARGELAPQQAVMSGRLKVTGDVSVLLRHADALRAVEDAFAAARASTTY